MCGEQKQGDLVIILKTTQLRFPIMTHVYTTFYIQIYTTLLNGDYGRNSLTHLRSHLIASVSMIMLKLRSKFRDTTIVEPLLFPHHGNFFTLHKAFNIYIKELRGMSWIFKYNFDVHLAL